MSASSGGAAITITDDGTATSPNEFQVAYAEFSVVGQVRDWSYRPMPAIHFQQALFRSNLQ